jgi:hypothetical protein
MAKTSTNSLTKRYCASRGWPCQTVQAFYGGTRHDLFGLWDSMVLHPLGILFVQNCSYGTLKAHRDQMSKNEHLAYFEDQTTIEELWEWRRKKVGRKKLWFLRTQPRCAGRWGEISDWLGPLSL